MNGFKGVLLKADRPCRNDKCRLCLVYIRVVIDLSDGFWPVAVLESSACLR